MRRLVIPGTVLAVSALLIAACSDDNTPLPPEMTRPQLSMHGRTNVTQDTWLSQTNQNANFGADLELDLRESAKNRILIQFNDDEINAAKSFLDATNGRIRLRVTIANNPGNWGSGGQIDVHRMTQGWVEGGGPDDTSMPGATYNCAEDTDLTNNQVNCDPGDDWDVRKNFANPWLAQPTASAIITTGQTGTLEFDVTDDVKFFAANSDMNFGWVVKRFDEEQAGEVSFHSFESTSGPELGRSPCPLGETCGFVEATVSAGANSEIPVAAGVGGAACDPQLGTNCVAQLFIEQDAIKSITPAFSGALLFGLLQLPGTECLGLSAGLEIGPCVEGIAVDLEGNRYVVEFNNAQQLAACLPSSAVGTRIGDLSRLVRRQGFDPNKPGPALPNEKPLQVLGEAAQSLALDCASLLQGGGASASPNRLMRFAASIWNAITGRVSPQPLHAAVTAITAVGHTKNTTSSPLGLSHFSWAKILFPHRDAGYRFATVGKKCDACSLSRIPKDWFKETFLDDGPEWQDGVAPFHGVSQFGSPAQSCDLYENPDTWPAADPRFKPPQETFVLLRKSFEILEEIGNHDGDISLEVRIAGRNGFRVWLNDVEITSNVTEPPDVKVKKNSFVELDVETGVCPNYDDFIFKVPESMFRIGDENLLAVMGKSSEDEPSFADVQVNVIEGT